MDSRDDRSLYTCDPFTFSPPPVTLPFFCARFHYRTIIHKSAEKREQRDEMREEKKSIVV